MQTWLSADVAAQSRDDLDNVRLAFDASLQRGDSAPPSTSPSGLQHLWRNAVSYTEGRWVAALSARELDPRDRLWTLILAADVGLGAGDPRMMRDAAEQAAQLVTRLDDAGGAVIASIYAAMTHLASPAKVAERLQDAADRARAAGEPGLERLARGFRLVPLRMLGRTDRLTRRSGPDRVRHRARLRPLHLPRASSVLALVDLDGPRLRALMDIAQLADLVASGLHGNWLTLYWEALAMISTGEAYPLLAARPATGRARRPAGRRRLRALALAYAAACRDEWERSAELLATAGGALLDDTAGFIYLAMAARAARAPAARPVRVRGRHGTR